MCNGPGFFPSEQAKTLNQNSGCGIYWCRPAAHFSVPPNFTGLSVASSVVRFVVDVVGPCALAQHGARSMSSRTPYSNLARPKCPSTRGGVRLERGAVNARQGRGGAFRSIEMRRNLLDIEAQVKRSPPDTQTCTQPFLFQHIFTGLG